MSGLRASGAELVTSCKSLFISCTVAELELAVISQLLLCFCLSLAGSLDAGTAHFNNSVPDSADHNPTSFAELHSNDSNKRQHSNEKNRTEDNLHGCHALQRLSFAQLHEKFFVCEGKVGGTVNCRVVVSTVSFLGSLPAHQLKTGLQDGNIAG
jgi:hypothetical protein